MKISHFRELEVYQKAKGIAVRVFEISKQFPNEEKYSMTDQIRRSSRSVCANIAEAWRKRRYKAAFLAKLSDCEGECSETQVWLELACDHGYITKEQFTFLDQDCEHVSAMLIKMSNTLEKWTI
jgi:four helix bundle protein